MADERKELWEKICTHDPNLEKLLEKVRAVFGKPEKLKVTFTNIETVRVG